MPVTTRDKPHVQRDVVLTGGTGLVDHVHDVGGWRGASLLLRHQRPTPCAKNGSRSVLLGAAPVTGRYEPGSPVEARYPRTPDELHGRRAEWGWLPGTVTGQCGPDEWAIELDTGAVCFRGRQRNPARGG